MTFLLKLFICFDSVLRIVPFLVQRMARPISFVFLASWTAVAFPLPRNSFDNVIKGSRVELESSGSGPDEPVRGIVKVMRLDPRAAAQSGFFRGLSPRRAPSHSSRFSFPAFLSHGRLGPAPAPKAPVSPLHLLHPKSTAEMELKKRQGLQMWQRAVGKGDKMSVSLPIDLRDTKQACTAVPFTQVRGFHFPSLLNGCLCSSLPTAFK